MVHGHGEHQGRYKHVADHFAEHNLAFLSFDQPGHGKSEGKRGHIKHYDDFHRCIDYLLSEAEKTYPGVEKYLYGHSMGGNITLNYAIRKKPSVAGFIITSPWLESTKGPTAIQYALGKMMLKIYPGFTQKTGLATNALSRDGEIVKAYMDDPLVHSYMSTNLFFSCMEAAAYSIAHADQLNRPMLLMHGDADGIADIKGTDKFAKQAGFLVQYDVWKGAFHELHNEPGRAKVLSRITNWINSPQNE
jgi:alpha-beta hydrolase superfamily lysophospholipase